MATQNRPRRTSPVKALLDFGQSPWRDFIQRGLLDKFVRPYDTPIASLEATRRTALASRNAAADQRAGRGA